MKNIIPEFVKIAVLSYVVYFGIGLIIVLRIYRERQASSVLESVIVILFWPIVLLMNVIGFVTGFISEIRKK